MKQGGDFLLTPVVQPIFTREMFSQDLLDIEKMVREFAREQITPRKEELESPNEELTMELMRQAGELGLTGVDIPEKYGGLEMDKTTSAMVVESLTMGGSASLVVTFSAHVGIGTLPLVYFGSEEQKQKYLPKLASVEDLATYCLTEAEAGSDALNMKATAKPTEDGEAYLLNGTKIYATNGGWSGIYTVFANLEGHGVSAFIVERGSEGLTLGPEEKKLGIKGSSTVSVFFENVRVPKENLLGRPGKGGDIALNVLNIGRFKLGAADLGGCKMLVDLVAEYAMERHQFGQPIAYFEAIRKKIAKMVVSTYGLDAVIYRTVGMMDERIAKLNPENPKYSRNAMGALEEFAIEASISKVLGSETVAYIVDQGIQVYGGNGFSEEYPLAGVYRDARIDRIFEGTNEINRMVIYGYFLKKALMEELPVRDAGKSWKKGMEPREGFLSWEIGALDRAQRMITKLLYEAMSRYGQDLRNAQIVGEDLSDLIIGYYAASSAINRILQKGEAAEKDTVYLSLARLTLAGFLEEFWRLYYRLRPVLLTGPYAGRFADQFDEQMRDLYPPYDPVEEVHRLTDDLYSHGHYRFE